MVYAGAQCEVIVILSAHNVLGKNLDHVDVVLSKHYVNTLNILFELTNHICTFIARSEYGKKNGNKLNF